MLRGDVALKGGYVANLHVTMAVPNCEYFEVLLPHSAQKYGLIDDIVVDAEGYVHAPTAPGLGYVIDWERSRANSIAVLS